MAKKRFKRQKRTKVLPKRQNLTPTSPSISTPSMKGDSVAIPDGLDLEAFEADLHRPKPSLENADWEEERTALRLQHKRLLRERRVLTEELAFVRQQLAAEQIQKHSKPPSPNFAENVPESQAPTTAPSQQPPHQTPPLAALSPKPNAPNVPHTSLQEWLYQQGITAKELPQALRGLVETHPEQCLSLHQSNDTWDRHFQGAFQRWCGDPECEIQLRRTPVTLLLDDEPKRCANCEGSSNRRAFRKMVRYCRKARCYQVTIVGGSPDTHKELQRFNAPGVTLTLIDGQARRYKYQATEDLRRSDLVVIWGSTILPHSLSELYTRQRDLYPNKLVFVHKRGITSLVEEACRFLQKQRHPHS